MPAQPYVPGGWADWNQQAQARIATPGLRIGAKVIDVVFMVIVQIVISIVAAVAFLSSSSAEPFTTNSGMMVGANVALNVAVAAVGLLIDFVYNVVLVAKFGGQPGKLLLGLRIVSTDGTGPDMGVAFRRWSPMLAILVLSAIPVVGLLGGVARLVLIVANLVMIFADDRRRDVFDHVGGTYVVATR
jgi:uncharacterized RDD family membrane protein YckC